jgi:hypothetical protein
MPVARRLDTMVGHMLHVTDPRTLALRGILQRGILQEPAFGLVRNARTTPFKACL